MRPYDKYDKNHQPGNAHAAPGSGNTTAQLFRQLLPGPPLVRTNSNSIEFTSLISDHHHNNSDDQHQQQQYQQHQQYQQQQQYPKRTSMLSPLPEFLMSPVRTILNSTSNGGSYFSPELNNKTTKSSITTLFTTGGTTGTTTTTTSTPSPKGSGIITQRSSSFNMLLSSSTSSSPTTTLSPTKRNGRGIQQHQKNSLRSHSFMSSSHSHNNNNSSLNNNSSVNFNQQQPQSPQYNNNNNHHSNHHNNFHRIGYLFLFMTMIALYSIITDYTELNFLLLPSFVDISSIHEMKNNNNQTTITNTETITIIINDETINTTTTTSDTSHLLENLMQIDNDTTLSTTTTTTTIYDPSYEIIQDPTLIDPLSTTSSFQLRNWLQYQSNRIPLQQQQSSSSKSSSLLLLLRLGNSTEFVNRFCNLQSGNGKIISWLPTPTTTTSSSTSSSWQIRAPGILLPGGSSTGTWYVTSLLHQHPYVVPARVKELSFFYNNPFTKFIRTIQKEKKIIRKQKQKNENNNINKNNNDQGTTNKKKNKEEEDITTNNKNNNMKTRSLRSSGDGGGGVSARATTTTTTTTSIVSETINVMAAREKMFARDYSIKLLQQNSSYLSIDGTSGYLFYSMILSRRILCVIPWVQNIIVIRNPIERLISQYISLTKQHGLQMNIYEWIQQDIQLMQNVGLLPTTTTIDTESDTETETETTPPKKMTTIKTIQITLPTTTTVLKKNTTNDTTDSSSNNNNNNIFTLSIPIWDDEKEFVQYSNSKMEDESWYDYLMITKFGCIGRSIYSIQLKQWFNTYRYAGFHPKYDKKVLIIHNDKFLMNTQQEYNRILQFVQLPIHPLSLSSSSSSSSSSTPPTTPDQYTNVTTTKVLEDPLNDNRFLKSSSSSSLPPPLVPKLSTTTLLSYLTPECIQLLEEFFLPYNNQLIRLLQLYEMEY